MAGSMSGSSTASPLLLNDVVLKIFATTPQLPPA